MGSSLAASFFCLPDARAADAVGPLLACVFGGMLSVMGDVLFLDRGRRSAIDAWILSEQESVRVKMMDKQKLARWVTAGDLLYLIAEFDPA